MRKDRDGSVLSDVKVSRWLLIAYLDELEPCSGCRNHCLNLLIVYDNTSLWSSSTWCVTTAWGSSPCIHLLAVGWFPAYTYYVLLSVVNPFLNCLNLIKIAYVSYFISLDQFEHLLALVFVATHIKALVRASFQSDRYNLEDYAFLHSLHS
jgi:hypothetical protein